MSCRCRGVRLGRLGPAGAAAPLRERENGAVRRGRTTPERGGIARDPHPQHGRLKVWRGDPPPSRAWCGPARPYLPSIAAAAGRVPPGPRALHRCRGVPGRFRGPGTGVTSPARAGSAAWAPPGRRGRRAPAPPPRESPQRWAARPGSMEGSRLRAVLPDCTCAVNTPPPSALLRFPRGFGKMASPAAR